MTRAASARTRRSAASSGIPCFGPRCSPFHLMAAVQELCARIALQTGVGLGIALRRKFPTWLVGACIAALFVANTINVGADLGAVAAGGSLLTKGAVREVWLVVPVAVLVLALQFFVTYRAIFKIFKWLTLALFAYVITGFLVHPRPAADRGVKPRPAHRAQQELHRSDRRHPRHHDLSLSVLLAGIVGGR